MLAGSNGDYSGFFELRLGVEKTLPSHMNSLDLFLSCAPGLNLGMEQKSVSIKPIYFSIYLIN